MGLTRRKFLGTSAMLSFVGTAALSAAPRKSIPATVSADLTSAATPVNRMIFGQFIEHFHRQVYGGIFEPGSPLSDEMGLRKDVITALRELGVPVVRWPGGCFVSAYHWKNGVGQQRVPAYDKAWKVEDPNTFGTDEFVTWCRKIGAEPYICTNAGTGTPEEMSDWVEYCNLDRAGQYARMRRANGYAKPHNVKYWSIGNENYGAWEAGAKTVDQWGYFVRESAKLMRFVDPSIKLFAAATADRNWTMPLLERAGQYLDYISIHGYWDPLWQDNNASDYLTCMMRSVQPEAQIRSTVEVIEAAKLTDRVKIAFDEWNLRGWHHPGHSDIGKGEDLLKARDKNDLNETYTMADACFSACFLNACIRQARHVHMANMAPIVNARGPLFVHPKGIVKRTTFHVMKMYSDLLEPNVVETSVAGAMLDHAGASVPVLDAVVTRSDDGRALSAAIVNRHPDAKVPCHLAIKGVANDSKATVTTLSGDNPDAYNDVSKPEKVVPETQRLSAFDGSLALPPHSVTIVNLRT